MKKQVEGVQWKLKSMSVSSAQTSEVDKSSEERIILLVKKHSLKKNPNGNFKKYCFFLKTATYKYNAICECNDEITSAKIVK